MKRIRAEYQEAPPRKRWRYKERKPKEVIKRIRATPPRPELEEADDVMQYHLARIRYSKEVEARSWKAIADYLAANDPAEPMPRPLDSPASPPQRAPYRPGAAVRRP